MTLIAKTSNFSYPIIIGDILMSSALQGKNIPLPTFPHGAEDLLSSTQSFFPFNLRQKIYVISDNLAIALAGSEFEIKRFLDDIQMHFRYYESTKLNIEEFYNRYDFSNFTQSACILSYFEKNDDKIIFETKKLGPWREIESKTFETAAACGTGSTYFLDNTANDTFLGNAEDQNPLLKAISVNYVSLCNLLRVEKLSLETIRNSWGAGFEMIFFNGEKFQKMDDITFILWKGKVDLESVTYEAEPFLILNFRYFNNILLISADDTKSVEGYAVLPLNLKKEEVDFDSFPKEPHFNTNKIVSSYVLEFSNGKIYTPSFYAESHEYPYLISADLDEEGYMNITIQKDLEEGFIQNIRQLIVANKV